MKLIEIHRQWSRHVVMKSWMYPTCVCGCNGSKKAECRLPTNQDNLGLYQPV
ncbi:hypothetical protein C0J52_08750 [Blattella germanica]|nr:hypothetical protein C0J52_08750 [Blattella germanica]